MSQSGAEGAHQDQAVGALEIFFKLLAPLDVAQQQYRADKVTVGILQRRDRDADRHLSAPAADEIAFSTRAFLARRVRSPDKVDEPRLALEDLFERLAHGARR